MESSSPHSNLTRKRHSSSSPCGARSGSATPDEVIDAYLPEEFSKELVEAWYAKYLAYWASRIRSGEGSPTSER